MREENKILKEIEKTKDKVDELSNKPEEVVVIEDCEDTDDKEDNSDISDAEAAEVFLRNMRVKEGNQNNRKQNPTNQSGTKPKSFQCERCMFEVKSETKLKGHKTVHEKGNVNFVPMVECERCAVLFKTTGLLRRHLKVEHGINLTSIPDSQDGARSLPNKEDSATKSRPQRIRCDQCDFMAETKHILIAHLEEKHSKQTCRCKTCGMTADNKAQLNKHIQDCHKPNKDVSRIRRVCRFWQSESCTFD